MSSVRQLLYLLILNEYWNQSEVQKIFCSIWSNLDFQLVTRFFFPPSLKRSYWNSYSLSRKKPRLNKYQWITCIDLLKGSIQNAGMQKKKKNTCCKVNFTNTSTGYSVHRVLTRYRVQLHPVFISRVIVSIFNKDWNNAHIPYKTYFLVSLSEFTLNYHK